MICIVCNNVFQRRGSRGPIPKYCGIACRAKNQRSKPERKDYEKRYYREVRREPSKWAEILAKGKAYRRNLGESYRSRMRERWHRLYGGTAYPEVIIAAPYTNHRWLQHVRSLVLPPGGIDESAPWADNYYDEMGEALLALLEGKDPKEAIKNYRKQEYVPRYRTIRIGEWGDDEDQQRKFFESVMPTVESAEDQAITRETIVDRVLYSRGSNIYRNKGRHGKTQPKRRRMKDGRSWQKHL